MGSPVLRPVVLRGWGEQASKIIKDAAYRVRTDSKTMLNSSVFSRNWELSNENSGHLRDVIGCSGISWDTEPALLQ